MKASSAIWISILFSCCLSATAQRPLTAPSGQTPSESAVTTAADVHGPITLDVAVTDRDGKAITGLGEQDFTLLDNKQPQKLVSFRAVDGTSNTPPAEVVLVVDAVNASFINVSYERDQIDKFLGQNGGKLAVPVSLIIFTDTKTSVETAPTRDGNALISLFDKNVTGLRSLTRATGFYGAEDRLQISVHTLGMLASYEATKPGRKLIIWVSPGWPILTGPRIYLGNREQQSIFNTAVALSTVLRQAHITLYSVDPLGTADAAGLRTVYYENFLKGLKNANKAEAGNLALQVIATQSGGEVLHSSNDITSELARCATDAQSYYELTFDQAHADGPNDYHELAVKIDKAGLTARTRTGYYAQP